MATDDAVSTDPTSTEETKPRRQPWMLYAIGAVILLCIAAFVFPAVKGDKTDGFDAQVVCRDFVRDRLKAPSTADFSDVDHTGSAPTFTVTGNVDAENSFGAMLRMRFTCVVEDAGDQWRLKSLTGLT